MVCGKNNGNEPLQDFILQSPAPIDTAVKLSSLYREMSEKEKERAKDLIIVASFAENLAVDLLGSVRCGNERRLNVCGPIAASQPASTTQRCSSRPKTIAAGRCSTFSLKTSRRASGRRARSSSSDRLQKEVVSYASVQRYLTEVWMGRVEWSFAKFAAFAIFVFFCPPAWRVARAHLKRLCARAFRFYFSLPLNSRIGELRDGARSRSQSKGCRPGANHKIRLPCRFARLFHHSAHTRRLERKQCAQECQRVVSSSKPKAFLDVKIVRNTNTICLTFFDGNNWALEMQTAKREFCLLQVTHKMQVQSE